MISNEASTSYLGRHYSKPFTSIGFILGSEMTLKPCARKDLPSASRSLHVCHFWSPNAGGFFHTSSKSLRCQPGVSSFSSDTVSLQSVSPHSLRAQSHETEPTSNARCKSQVVTCASDQLTIDQSLHEPFLGSRTGWNGSENSEKLFLVFPSVLERA